jgi:hypothetical protein
MAAATQQLTRTEDSVATTSSSITCRAHARVGFLGNPSDGYFGKTISFSLANFYAEVKALQRSSQFIGIVMPLGCVPVQCLCLLCPPHKVPVHLPSVSAAAAALVHKHRQPWVHLQSVMQLDLPDRSHSPPVAKASPSYPTRSTMPLPLHPLTPWHTESPPGVTMEACGC